MSKAVEDKLARASVSLITLHPFFATILLKLRRVEDPTCDTMWTDGHSLGYSPEFVMELPQEELVSVLMHEVLHVAALHPWRRGTRDPYEWNVACDKVCNAILEEQRRPLPEGAIPGVPDKAAEELYSHPPEKGDEGGQGEGESAPGSNPDPGRMGEVRDAKNPDGSSLSEAEREQQMQEARIMVQQAVNASKKAGQLPAGLKRFADDLLEPKVPWKEVLAQFIDSFARQDYSWIRPNRRYLQTGMILPSLWSPAIGNIVMGCDTSGSVNPEDLREICSEVLGAMEVYTEQGQEPELTVAWFDTKVYPQTVNDPEELEPKGGGGTSFRAVFEWLAEQEERPQGVVMITDGYCSDFGEDPGIPVLWVLTQTNLRFDPPFGEVTNILNS